jgi:hypothetical protein
MRLKRVKRQKCLNSSRNIDNPISKGVAIVGKDEFLKNWKEFTQGCLDGMNWANVFAAGGAVLGCLSANQDGYRGSDIDLFVYGIVMKKQLAKSCGRSIKR